ncbi:MAG: T9SS type A sorting domain-containing protein [Flavobacteriales bacterium]|nr:T9SS type A sorting domain-containing protein [Flavobacteriales bacterium]
MRIEQWMMALPLAMLLGAGAAMGQGVEQVVPLGGNPMLRDASEFLARHRAINGGGQRASDTLTLPFFDDFAEPFSRENVPADLYPDTNLWIGRSVYINNHMAVNPISIGVATFDGLDERGQAYGFGFAIPTASDTLQSKPIDLSSKQDTVYLSFHYQAQGRGLAPAVNDRLTLEFKDTANAWQEVWDANGYELTDSSFQRAMLPIVEGEFLHAGFQFRFINLAALAGSVDHWHLDYLLLDDARTAADTFFRDMAMVEGDINLLRNYSSMPWPHYKADSVGQTGPHRYMKIRNSASDVYPTKYGFNVFNAFGTRITEFDTADVNTLPYVLCGNRLQDCGDTIGFEMEGWRFPIDNELSSDSNYFIIEHTIDTIVDVYKGNNRLIGKQRFYNYYAYDDGTAEVGYGLGNLQLPGQVAIRFDAVMPDSLRAIQYYLNPVAEDLSGEPVRFMVWRGDAVPEELLYMSEEVNFDYSTGINYMNHFFLDEPIGIEGSFFIGWQQQPVTGQKFSIGLDRQTDAKENVFYRTGIPEWTQSSIPGAVMFRPVFGKPYDWTIGVEEHTAQKLEVYPNPSTGIIYLREATPGQFASAYVHLYDLTGRAVLSQRGYVDGIDATDVNPGLYILEVQTGSGQRFAQRVILQP